VKQTFVHRLHKLEGTEAAGRLPGLVVYIGLDGEPDVPWEQLPPERVLLVLPHKAASVEAWTAMVRQRFAQNRVPGKIV
jgi:hypothetical protein